MMKKPRGQSIRLFLVDGTASGLIVASIPNWTGSIVVGRSVQLNELLGRSEAKRAGCYILQGEEPSHPMGVKAYIGQAARIEERLKTHARQRDWWDTAAIITTSDTNFTAGHFLALEAKMIQVANENGRAAIENQISPNAFAGGLGEADQADMENFFDQLRLVLPVLGFNVLKESVARKADRPPASPSDTDEILEIAHRSGVRAKAVIRDDEFIVLEGSFALTESPYQHNGYAALRQALIDQGVLIPDEETGFLRFVRDTAFSSSSAAAAVVLNRQSSGPKEWRFSSRKQSLGAWQEEQARFLGETDEAAE